MEKLRNFYRKYLKNYLVLHPLVAISNVLLIFAIISLSMLFHRRIFALVLLGMIPMAVASPTV